MTAHIQVRGLSKRYEAFWRPALDGIDLDVEAGRITAIMGPSGCGKSTLLNLIGALDRPSAGEIVVDGVRVDRLSESAAAVFRRTRIGFVFQLFHLLDDLSVRENVEVPALLAGRTAGEARASADALIAQLGMTDLAGGSPARLSGGERQRLAIARAVVNRPAILLADEPTGALDRTAGQGALALLEDLNRRGQTIVLVTHDRQLAEHHAHRIVELVDGRVVGDQAVPRAA